MRITCLSPYLPPPVGGIEKEMLALARELLALGHDVEVLATTARFPAGENPAPPDLGPGIACRRRRGYGRSTLRGFVPSRAPLWVPGLAADALASRPDLALVFNVGWGPPLRPVLRALAAARTPSLYRTYFHPPGGRLGRLKARYILGTVAGADLAFVATEGERRELVATGCLEEARVRVVPPGIHHHPDRPERVAEIRRRLDLAGRTVVAHVGRLGHFKGTTHLVEVLAEVRRRSAADVVLLLVGADQDRLFPALAERHGVAAHVRLAGEVDDDAELHALLRAADLFAMPSAYEAFGIAYIEALGAGLACVGCDVGGVGEAIGDGGLLVGRFGDRDQLVEALVRLVAEPALRRELGERGRKRVLASLTWRHTASRLLELAREVAGGRAR